MPAEYGYKSIMLLYTTYIWPFLTRHAQIISNIKMKFIIIVAKIHSKKIKLVPRYLYTSIYKVLNKN